MKTYSAKPSEITRQWYIIDAKGETLGRLSTIIATHLSGKNKPQYTSHIDCGDNVVIINASLVHVSGNKLEDKKYYHHSGYPGGIKEISLAAQMEKDPREVIKHAVRGMLPKNRLTDDRMNRLKVYAGAEHAHTAQTPKSLEISTSNGKRN
ncbi:MAG: 50S ribosomal protein L13 [Candidatus Saccharimonadia bacterium]